MKTFLSMLTLLLSSIYVFAQAQPTCNPYPKTITVSGSADMEIVPDEIYVQIDLREYKKKGEEKVELEKIKADFLDKCKSVDIEDSAISIASYSGTNYAAWFWKKRKKDPDLYSTISYQIKFKGSKKMDALVAILDDEATTNFRVFKTSHSKISEFRKQLKIQAIKAAKEKAIYLTDAINEKVGEAITIEEPGEPENSSVNQNAINYRQAKDGILMEEKIVDNIPSIDFKKIKLVYKVKVVFAVK
ncbi:SIMPL domain-containing protein [Ferruginibacter albus]|uniref:SIMPL domain-containing protein n=1 Tax=Ferruginibacter albus TaxID=2875540 RepID=UPI001CC4D852|nr:SIMPL domain-containing protein [Ferruginibacter albus]UAY52651.1 SIMPL domain-containing protein [Ferruginibacter albus]